MLTTLQNEDLELDLYNINKQDIYTSLTLNDVKVFLKDWVLHKLH